MEMRLITRSSVPVCRDRNAGRDGVRQRAFGGLVHTIPVNVEPETRSLNTRYKNIYTPYGTKGMLDYFVPLALSPLAGWRWMRRRPKS